jgi:hypothetical protein
MSKVIYLTAICLFIAVAIFGWSQNAVFSSRSAASAVTDGSALTDEAPRTLKTSPVEMMNNYNRLLPAEQWDAF